MTSVPPPVDSGDTRSESDRRPEERTGSPSFPDPPLPHEALCSPEHVFLPGPLLVGGYGDVVVSLVVGPDKVPADVPGRGEEGVP